MTNKGYINLDDNSHQDYQPPNSSSSSGANTILPSRSSDTPNSSSNYNFDPPPASAAGTSTPNPSDPSHVLQSELSSVEDEMLHVAEAAFNRQREQAHRDIDQLYDRLIDATRSKVQGLTSDVVQQVTSGNNY